MTMTQQWALKIQDWKMQDRIMTDRPEKDAQWKMTEVKMFARDNCFKLLFLILVNNVIFIANKSQIPLH